MSQTSKDLWPATVFYDGSCGVCKKFVNRLRRKDQKERFRYVDVSAEDFRAEDHGLDPERVMESLHVKTAGGEVFRGIDGIRLIWSAFPFTGVAAFLTGIPGIHFLADAAYKAYARNRHGGDVCRSGQCER